MSDVLLLHAGIADRRMWAPQLVALEGAGHRVLAPDLPGFGDAALEPPTVDYVAFAVDMFGDGKNTEHPEDAGKWSSAVAQNKQLGIDRFNAALELFKKNAHVDANHIAAIGYCFGGGVVLTMALQGADLDGVATFHGALPTEPATGKVTASILVCHGAADPLITPEQVATLQKNLVDAGADWEIIVYGGAKHSFTNPGADAHNMPPLAYNEKADKRSWQALLDFLAEVCK